MLLQAPSFRSWIGHPWTRTSSSSIQFVRCSQQQQKQPSAARCFSRLPAFTFDSISGRMAVNAQLVATANLHEGIFGWLIIEMKMARRR
jgi:hypothetical protein